MTILEDLKSGRLVVVPREATAFQEWLNDRRQADVSSVFHEIVDRFRTALTASPDHTAGLIALVEGMERERAEAEQALRTVQNAAKTIASAHGTELEHLRQNARFDHALRAEVESLRQHGSEMTDALLAAEARALAAEAERDVARAGRAEAERENKRLDRELTAAQAGQIANIVRREEANAYGDAEHARALAAEAERDEAREEADTLKALICQIEPHIDAIVCYASTIGEHEPNRIAREVRSVCHGPSQDELAGRQIAERMISKIDAAATKPSVERGWLIELKGSVPSWAAVNPKDYDEHWTTDSTKALRLARREDAQSYIDHIGWTEAFPSEHIWDDGDRHDQ